MYSIMPAFVSALFLVYGLYVLLTKGITPSSLSFSVLCIATFFWQATWAVLFQTHDPTTAILLIKFGYFLIIFLPNSLYLFLVEISADSINIKRDRIYIAYSYGLDILLAFLALSTNLFVSGYYEYFFGYYPKAGPLHIIHVIQTALVVSRGLYVTYTAYRSANAENKKQLRLCILSIFIYFMAAIDYLCNYGFEFYPPGILFITISLGIIAVAIFKYDLMSPYTLAATIAHELRTPLATMHLQAAELSRNLSTAINKEGQIDSQADDNDEKNRLNLERLESIPKLIQDQINKSNTLINILLASATLEKFDAGSFSFYSAHHCINEALTRYPFTKEDRLLVTAHLNKKNNFKFFGSDTLLIFVLFNLMKNALYAIKSINKGDINIFCSLGEKYNTINFVDTGPGIQEDVLKKMFNEFYSTKKRGDGAGIGLSFCKNVMKSFNGEIVCESAMDQYTKFSLHFPRKQ